MEHTTNTSRSVRRCAGGAIALTVLAGLVTLPATAASATPGTQVAAAAASTDDAATTALTVTHGLRFAPADRLGLTGTATAGSNVTLNGLPRQGGAIDGPTTVRTGQDGRWFAFTEPGSAVAASYDLSITSDGTTIDVTTVADPEYAMVRRELTVPAGQTFARGERPTVSGTADAYTSVQVTGLPGWEPGRPGVGAVADEHGEWTVTGEQPATGFFVVEARGSGLGQNTSLQEWVEQAHTEAEFAAFTIEDGLTYAPGTRLTLSGRTLPGAVVKVDGLPFRDGTPVSRRTHRTSADAEGRWTVVTDSGLATADHYDLTFTVGGSTVDRRASADEAYNPVQRDVTIAEGQTFVHGEIATVTGTADAFTSVRVDGLPGRGAGYGVRADRDGNWTATSAEPATRAFQVRVNGLQHGQPSPVVSGVVLPEPRDGEFEAFTVEQGLVYKPGRTLGLTGSALPYSRIEIDGVPGDSGAVRSVVTVADVDGRWTWASANGAPTADRYDLTFTVGGSSVEHAAVADPSLEIVERTLAFAPGQSFVIGERAVLRGTADAYSAVYVRGLPGDPSNGQAVLTDARGEWVATSGAPVTERTEVSATGWSGGAFRGIQAAIVPREPSTTPPIAVATETFTKGQKQLIEGTAAPRARVDVYSGSKYLMHVTADEDGKWSYTTGGAITADSFTRTLKSADADDHTFTLTAAESEETAPITVATETFTKGQKQLIEGTAAPRARVDVYSGSKYLMHVTADDDGKWSYTTGAAITADTFTRTLRSAGVDDVTFTLTAR